MNIPKSRDETVMRLVTLKALPFMHLVSHSTSIYLALISGDVLSTEETAVNKISSLKELRCKETNINKYTVRYIVCQVRSAMEEIKAL